MLTLIKFLDFFIWEFLNIREIIIKKKNSNLKPRDDLLLGIPYLLVWQTRREIHTASHVTAHSSVTKV